MHLFLWLTPSLTDRRTDSRTTGSCGPSLPYLIAIDKVATAGCILAGRQINRFRPQEESAGAEGRTDRWSGTTL
jgi:hypothetical protein